MKTAFKDDERGEHFLKYGYCTFPLLDDTEIDFIEAIYREANGSDNKLHQQQFYGVNYSLGTLGPEENRQIMSPIVQMLQSKLDLFFAEFEILGCVFITKPSQTNTTFVYHQDWNYTYEDQFAFATCWVPLSPVSPVNGGMSVIKGSHTFFKTFRSADLDSARIDFEKIPEEIRTDIYQRRGECLSFHQGAFHGSYPNLSDNDRVVLAFVVKPKSAPIVHYRKDSDKIVAYEMSCDDFNKMLLDIPAINIPKGAIATLVLDQIPQLPSASEVVANWRQRQDKHRLLRNEDDHLKFIRQGYILLRDVIPVQSVLRLKSIYEQNFAPPQGMQVSHHYETDANRNMDISAQIYDLVSDTFREIFIDYQLLLSHFASKGRGQGGLFNFHQDWSIVEEEIYGVLHCWIPLQNVNRKNGTLAVLPKSHLCFHNYRSGSCGIRFTPIDSYDPMGKHIDANVGDIILYHPALFHGSGPNESEYSRLAVVAAIANREADKVYYHREGDAVNLYELSEGELYGRLDYLANGGKPGGRVIKRVPYRVLEFPDSELIIQLRNFSST